MSRMKTSISTNQVVQKERFRYWQEFVSDFCLKIDSKRLNDDRFFGEVDAFELAQFEIATIKSSPIEVVQTRFHVSQSTESYYKVTIQLDGDGILQQNGEEILLNPGDWTIYDSTEPYTLIFPDTYEQLILKIPRSALTTQIPLIESLTAKRFDRSDGISLVAKQMMININQHYETVKSEHHARLANILLDLVTSSVNSSFLDLPVDRGNRTVWFVQIREFIDRHYKNCDLTIDQIARKFNFSKRYIHIIFQEENVSVAKYITKKRLAYAKQLLADPMQAHRTITEISLMAGFNNTAHFRKVFKQNEQLSPKAYRAGR